MKQVEDAADARRPGYRDPRSVTRMQTPCPCTRASTAMVVSAGANFAAFSSRLTSTCPSSVRSAWTAINSAGMRTSMRCEASTSESRETDSLTASPHIDWSKPQFQCAVRQARHVEQILNQPIEPLGLANGSTQQFGCDPNPECYATDRATPSAQPVIDDQRRTQIVRD